MTFEIHDSLKKVFLKFDNLIDQVFSTNTTGYITSERNSSQCCPIPKHLDVTIIF